MTAQGWSADPVASRPTPTGGPTAAPGPTDATFAVGLRVRGRLAVVLGGDDLAARTAARLVAAGARVLVVGPEPGPAIRDLDARGLIDLRGREYQPGDLDGACLLLACSDRDEVNAAAAADAARRNIWSAGPPDVQADATLIPAPAPPAPGTRVLVLGGARSGKSVLAESMLSETGAVDYVATGAQPGAGDAEWDDRVRDHRARRPPGWRTLETTDIAAVLAEPGAETPMLVDCLATWLARVMDDAGTWTGAAGSAEAVRRRLDELVKAWERTSRPVVAVSNEVGSGVVPATLSGRLFRDELGRLNARLAARSEQVWLCTAGIGQRLR